MINKPRILIVDDIPENVQVLYQTLNNSGDYSFTVTTNGEETFQVLKTALPDIILLDIMLPDISGIEICKIIKANPETANIPVIFLSARIDLEDKIAGFKAGAVDYITKPFEQEEVVARVSTHIKLKKADQNLRELNALKDKLFSIIGHDLRGPIGNFTSLLQLLLNNINKMSQTDMVELLYSMQQTANSTFSLLNNLLLWSRSQRGEIIFNPEEISIFLIVEDNMELLLGSAKSKKIQLVNKVKEECKAYGDDMMITTVLRNLISNAIKFTNESGTVTVFTKKTDGYITICVEDNGVGMAEEYQNKLFRKDQYFTTYGTNNEKGSGLGLSLCKEFVDLNRGKIWIESTLGTGSKLFFTLPNANK